RTILHSPSRELLERYLQIWIMCYLAWHLFCRSDAVKAYLTCGHKWPSRDASTAPVQITASAGNVREENHVFCECILSQMVGATSSQYWPLRFSWRMTF